MYYSCSGSVLSVGCKGSLSFSLNDDNYCLNNRCEITPITTLSSSSCYSCCANTTYSLTINPFLHGLRQSTLIQRSAYRRWMWGGCDRNFTWLPVYDFDRNCCCGKYDTIKTKRVDGRRGGRGNGRYGYLVSGKRIERRRLLGIDDAEAMLNLLTEETSEQCFDLRERNDKRFRKVQVGKRGKYGGSCHCVEKKNMDSGHPESKSRFEYESVTAQSSREDNMGKEDKLVEEREHFLRSVNLSTRERKEGSSCSSYYSFSSSGGFERDIEIEEKHGDFVEELSGGYTSGMKGNDETRYNEEIGKQEERKGYCEKEQASVMKKENVKLGPYVESGNIECDLRKKSEKRLADVPFEKTVSRKELSQKNSKFSKVHESGQSGSYKKDYDEEGKVSLVMNMDERKIQQYTKIADWVSGESEMRTKYKPIKEISETHGTASERTLRSQKQYRNKENVSKSFNLVQHSGGEHHKTTGHISMRDEYRRNSQQLDEVSDGHEIDVRVTSTSQRQSEIGMKKQVDYSTMSKLAYTEDQQHQAHERITGHIDARGKYQELSEVSDSYKTDTANTLISQAQMRSDMRVKNQEQISSLTSDSRPEGTGQHFQMDQKAIQRLESKGRSQNVTNLSVGHYSDTRTITNALDVFENRLNSQDRSSTLMGKSDWGTGEIHSVTNERISNIGPGKETKRPTKSFSFQEDVEETISSSQASVPLNFQIGVPQIVVDERKKERSETMLEPPSSQWVERGPLHGQLARGFALQRASGENLKNGSGALPTHTEKSSSAQQHEIYDRARMGDIHQESLNVIHQGDAFSSAQRLEQLSSQFVDEFTEKVRHEVSTSEIQKKKETVELVHSNEQHELKISSLHSSGDSQSKSHGLSHSSQASGTKGPSDEMWDVENPSIQDTPKTKEPEDTAAADKAVVKRTGRSLWNIIGDIAHLRWISLSAIRSSASKSGGRSSPNQSASTDTWFSGHDPDENSDETAKKEAHVTLQKLPSVNQQQLERSPAQSQDRLSPVSSRDEKERTGASSLSTRESESTSKVMSPSIVEDTFGKNTDGASFGFVVSETTLPLPAVQIRRSPTLGEISESGKSDASGSGTRGKDGELKRRKLQRSSQVPRDSFDEWEEAYRIEAEQRKIDEMFMREALVEAQKAADKWETPVGAVLVQHGKIIARGGNLVEELRDSTAHAEMICIRDASNKLCTWRLSETALYVTLEPCPMCAGAILQARIDTVVWGAPNKLLGADGSWIRLFPNRNGGSGLESTDKPAAPVHPFHPKMTIRRGVLASECGDIMQQFFRLRRKKQEKKYDPPSPSPSCLPVPDHPSKFFTKLHEIFDIIFCFH